MTEDIKITAVPPRIRYVADGITDTFSYIFPIFDKQDLNVYIGETLQTSGYTISGAGNTNGGEIHFETPPQKDKIITLLRNLEIKRTSDFQESGAFRAKAINYELDYQIACIQQLQEQINRSVTFPPYSKVQQTIELPTPEAGKALLWNDDATALCNSVVSINDMSNTLLDACNKTISAAEEVSTINNIALEAATTAQTAAQTAIDTADSISNTIEEINNKANQNLDNVVNVSNTFKEQSVSWGIPDYSAITTISITSGTPIEWTAPVDCFVHISVQGTGQCTAAIEDIASSSWINRYDAIYTSLKIISTQAYIPKGYTVRLRAINDVQFCYYVPLKGVN